MTDIVPTPPSPSSPLETENAAEHYDVGQWYWIPHAEEAWLGCVMQVGSNYLELQSPPSKHGHRTCRVHLDKAPTVLRREYDPHAVITGYITRYREKVGQLLGEVQAITARLGLQPQNALQDKSGGNAGTGLAVLSQQADIDGYKRALTRAHDQELPELFEQIKTANESLAMWMSAELLPLEAVSRGMQGHLGDIKDRVFNVTLYAGLTEEVVRCADGAPAAMTEKLHVMQRRLYMDEECLLGYQTGGMDINGIDEFDAWLCVPENRDRILPFPRTIVAMQVRRKEKIRDWDGQTMSLFVNINLAQMDKLTFLYIRNGEQVYRLNCDLDFDELIFPDKAMFHPDEPMMVKMFASRVEAMITVREYEDRLREYTEKRRLYDEWAAQNPSDSWVRNPYYGYDRFRPSEWAPFDDTNVYYDECRKSVADKIKRYNRIALIIQGLFDRSPVLHPHLPVKSWTADGFAAAIELVYDGSAVLYNGPPPNFEAYRARCNELIDKDSVLYGQDDYWQRKEAEKESARLDNDWRNRSEWRPTRYVPHGDPGPGVLARAETWQPRARKAVFSWNRKRRTQGDYWTKHRYGDPIRKTLTVPATELFNVSAYTPGDFKQFFQDPRTRAEYLKWAPMLLTAEEYYAGNREVQQPLAAEKGQNDE